MKRRGFITLAGSIVVCWPFIARAQQPAGPEIGLLNSASPSTFEDRLRAFRDGLKERQRIFMFGTNVNEMNVQPIDLGHELRQGVGPR